jgi:PAS domain S-box-containing protein
MGELEKLREENRLLKEKIDTLTAEFDSYKITEWERKTVLQALEDSLGGIAIFDRNWNIKYVNPSILKMWGYDSEEKIVGKKTKECFTEKSKKDLEKANKATVKNGCWQGELIGKKRDGSSFSVLVSQSVVKDKDGKVKNIVASCIETTEFKKALKDVADSEMRYRVTLDHLGDSIFVVNNNLNVALINNVLIDWWVDIGLEIDKMVGKNVFEALPFLPENVKSKYYIVFKTGETVIIESEFTLKGKRFVMETRMIPVFRGRDVDQVVTVMRDITVKKVVEEKLINSEEKYRLIADNVPVGFFIHVGGEIKYCGKETAHLLGYDDLEDIIGKDMIEFVHEDDREFVLNRAKKRVAGEDLQTGYEIKIIKKGGEILPVLVYGSTLNYLGETARQGVFIDISDRKKVEEERERLLVKLKDSEEQYRALIETSNDGVCVIKDLKTVFFNERLLKIMEYTEDEIRKRTFVDFIHPDDVEKIVEIHAKRMRGEDVPTTYEFRGVTKNGNVIPVEINIAMIDWEGGLAALCFLRNISRRKKAEKELEIFKKLVEKSEIGFAITDFSTKLTYVNSALCRIVGAEKPEDMLGNSVRSYYSDQFAKKIEEEILPIVMDGKPWTGELPLIAIDGHLTSTIQNIMLISTEEGNPLCYANVISDISERKEAEKSLRESEEKFRDLFENSLDAVFTADIKGNMTSANSAMGYLTGYKIDDMIGRNFREVMKTEEADRVFEAYNHLFQTGEPIKDFVYNIRRKDGEERIVEGNVNIIKKDKKIIGFQGTFRDITEKRETALALKGSEEKYRDLVENIEDMIYVMDGDGKFTFYNKALINCTGYTEDEVKTKNFKDFITPESFQYAKEVFERQVKGEDVGAFELQFIDKDGRLKIFETHERLIWKSGTIVEVHGIGRDITERKTTEQALVESEEKFRNLIESSKDVIYSTSVEGEFVDINPAGETLFGYTIEELLRMNIRDLYKNKEDRVKFQKVIAEQGFVKDYSIMFMKKDKSPADCLLTSTLRKAEDGTIVGYQGIIRDITENKLLEEQLLQAQKMKAVGTLAGGMAHNFNNILVGIMGYSEYLLSKKEKDDPDYKALSTIYESTVKASDLTRQLLNIARGGDYKRVKLDMNSVVKRVIPLIKGTIDKTIEIVTDYDTNLFATEGDVGQLEQCILNLCINSRDAMPDGGKIIIETKNQFIDEHFVKTHLNAKVGSYVVLSIADTGTGIAPDVIDHIFEPFFTTKKHAGGSGMGLATVYGIVKNLQGIITVYSEVGEGTTLRFYFPAIEEKVEMDNLPQKGLKMKGEETILLVDDDEVVREMWEEVLGEYGYKVVVSGSGKDAIEIVKERGEEIDMVILDVIMPDVGGKEVFEKIVEIEPKMKVLVTSGYSKSGHAKDILDAGALGFIQKPASIRDLTKMTRDILDGGSGEEVK